MVTGDGQRPHWRSARVARPARDLARSVAFYGDVLGLGVLGGFADHEGYDGVFFALPGGGELELTAGQVEPRAGTDEDLLVLYLGSLDEMAQVAADLVAQGVTSTRSANPYWGRWGREFLDPDGYRIVVAAVELDPRVKVHIDWHTGARAELRPLFKLAEDSSSQLDQYLELGRVLVARHGPEVIGHLQLLPTSQAGEIELKNMAVVPELQGTGVGRTLVVSAIDRCSSEQWSRMVVATAAADIGNLRFYQRMGFRMLSVDRDAFTATTGYPEPIMIDGIPLLDRLFLSQDLSAH